MRYRHRIYTAPVLMLLLGAVAGCNQSNLPAPDPIGPETLNVADAAIAGGDPDMALSVSQSILKDDPNNIDALIHEGDAYYALGRCPAAMAAYQVALQRDGKSAAAELGLGRCLLKTDPASAEAALLLAVNDDPGNAAAYNDLGIARDLQGNFAGAVAPYQRSLTLAPGNTATEVNLGLSLALSGNGPAALQYLGPLANGQGATPKIREDYAAALVASGRDADAQQILSIDLTPDQVRAALSGFNAVIAGAQAPLPQSAPSPPPTMPAVQTAAVSAAPLTPAPAPATPAPVAAPAPAMPPPPPASSTPADPNAAYTGPSPVPNSVSSSEPGPAGPPPAAAAQTAAAPPPSPPPAAAPMPAPAASGGSATGNAMVQLASLNSEDAAQAEWSKLSAANPSLFGSRQPDIQTAVVNGKTYYRLRTGGFASKADAAKFCGEVSAAGSTCTLANF
jgi:Flp pilus assembly protein TadD